MQMLTSEHQFSYYPPCHMRNLTTVKVALLDGMNEQVKLSCPKAQFVIQFNCYLWVVVPTGL